jgi:polyisoprenoid-binding protein YceI
MKSMKKLFLGFCIMFSTFSFAQTYTAADAESSLAFTIKNFGSKVKGSMKGLKGTLVWNAANLAACKFAVTADATTIFTDNTGRDKHLKKEDYFDVEKFPTVSFTSSKFSSVKAGVYQVEGVLTIKGTSKLVTIQFTSVPSTNTITFEGTLQINRRDYNVGGGSLILSNDVNMTLKVVGKSA